jgi:hypothetical protein
MPPVPYIKIGVCFLLGFLGVIALVMAVIGFLYFEQTTVTPKYTDSSIAPPVLAANPVEAWLTSFAQLRLTLVSCVLQGPTDVLYWNSTEALHELTEPGQVLFSDSLDYPVYQRPQGWGNISVDASGNQFVSSTPNGYLKRGVPASRVLVYSRTPRSGFELVNESTILVQHPDCTLSSPSPPAGASRVRPWFSQDGLQLYVTYENGEDVLYGLVKGRVAVYSRKPDSISGYTSTSTTWTYECKVSSELAGSPSVTQLGLIRPLDSVTGKRRGSDGYGHSVQGLFSTDGTRLLFVASLFPSILYMYRMSNDVFSIHASFAFSGVYQACADRVLFTRDGGLLMTIPLLEDGALDRDAQVVLQLGTAPRSIWIHPKGTLLLVGFSGRVDIFQWSELDRTWIQMHSISSPDGGVNGTFGWRIVGDPTGQVIAISDPCTATLSSGLSALAFLPRPSAWFVYTCHPDALDPRALLSARAIKVVQPTSVVSDGLNYSPDPLFDVSVRIDNQGEAISLIASSPLNQVVMFFTIVPI